MIARLREHGLVGPTLLMLAAFAILGGLGTWQLSRKAWKEGLITRIEQRSRATPIPLEQALAVWRQTGDVEYVRVRTRGRFMHEHERYLYAPDPKLGPGFHVYTPLSLADGAILMVNRGFVPERLRDPGTRSAGRSQGDVDVVGLLRAPGAKAAFTPDNEPASNVWYWRDLGAMLASAVPGNRVPWIPFFLDAAAEPANPGGWPMGGVTLVKLPNRHLEYALTWFGLAGTLLGVYAAFAWSRLRAPSAA
jgi:surfeit locus 1 family protein